VAIDFKAAYERIKAARQRLVELRAARVEELLRLQAYLRETLAEFFNSVDPITGNRFAELALDGNRAHGEISLTIATFAGGRLKISVDSQGHFAHAAVPDVFAGVERILDVRVSPDALAAQMDFMPAGKTRKGVQTVDFAIYVQALIERAIASSEADSADAP